MPERRANDAQVERLLHALKSDLSYRQDLAARIAEKENIKYASAMRRLQRYVTDAGEKRSLRVRQKFTSAKYVKTIVSMSGRYKNRRRRS